ncbi:MAG: aminomethyl-transferring glycine dehydrogenase subunit GcvPB, partial [Acholeplasmataceae bacterium]|nr:aminomethyl-transferring glycine dehydrogenase subunit GcvPB [Acholeplasmataceae bacterium]
MKQQPLLFELGKPGRKAIDLPACDVPQAENLLPAKYLRVEKAALPEVSQLELMRHYTQLSNRNF